MTGVDPAVPGLGIDPDELASCVQCGLCLPHCPTFRVTGQESRSPRGRIALMRLVQDGGAQIDGVFTEAMDTCVQCRGCEPACPSAVPFGRMMAATRETLAVEGRSPGRAVKVGFRVLGRPRLLRALSLAAAVAQRAHLVPRRLGLPRRLPLRRPALVPSGDDVWLFTGCVMDAWMRDVHAAVQRVIEATGAGVALPDARAACCGALHGHAGLGAEARRLAERTMAAFAGDAPILVDSAGCGAAMQEYGHLLGTPEAERFAARVVDVHTWLADRLDRLPARRRAVPDVVVQDPCHLRHVQRAHLPVRSVLGAVTGVRELDDEGLCCGAGGAFSVLQPELATAARDRKVAAIERAGGGVVVSANPGCALHLRAAGLEVRHPLAVVDEALGGPGGR